MRPDASKGELMVSNRGCFWAGFAYLVAAAVALVACSGPSKSKKDGLDTPPSAANSGMWALTPASAAAGIVIEDGTLTTLHAALLESLRIADANPLTKQTADEVRADMAGGPFNPFVAGDFARVGLDLSKGMAVWVDANDKVYAILPVSDPAKFVGIAQGHTTNEGGVEVDVYDRGAFRCAMKAGRYMCAETAAGIAEIGAGGPSPLAQQAMASTIGGQIRVVVDPNRYPMAGRLPGLDRYLTNVGALSIGATFETGGVSVKAHLPGKLVNEGQKMAAAPSLLAGKATAERPSGAIHARVDPSVFDIGDGPELPNGIKVSDLLSTLTGEVVVLSHAGTSGSVAIQVGLSSADTIRQLLEMGCTMAAGFNSDFKLRWDSGKCSGQILFNRMPPELRRASRVNKLDVDVSVAGNKLDVRVALGERGPVSNAPSPSGDGADMIAGNWNLSAWGEGLSPIYLLDLFNWNGLPADAREGAKAGLWVLGHLYEAGMAIGFRDDGIHGVIKVKTFAAAPAEEYKAYEAALARAVAGDWNGAKADLDALAKKSPNGMVARQVGLKSGAWLGVLGAGAVPVFMLRGEGEMRAPPPPPPPVVAP
jgi:hypothetical protein